LELRENRLLLELRDDGPGDMHPPSSFSEKKLADKNAKIHRWCLFAQTVYAVYNNYIAYFDWPRVPRRLVVRFGNCCRIIYKNNNKITGL